MRVLAIDTSNYVLGIAVIDNEQVIGEYITNIKKNHSIRVMPAIESLLKEIDVKPSDLTKIVVAEGPGSYTGVRIGVTIAKTLAWTLNIPLVGVSSLKVLATSVGRYFQGSVSPLFDARRGQIYTGLFQYRNNQIESIISDKLIINRNWVEQLKEQNSPILFVGNDLSIHKNVIKETLGENAVFAAITEYNPRPAELALLGKDMEGVNAHTFVPNYIRLAEAEAKWLEENKQN